MREILTLMLPIAAVLFLLVYYFLYHPAFLVQAMHDLKFWWVRLHF